MAWETPADESPLLETYSRPGAGLRRYDARGLGTLNALLLARETLDGGALDDRALDAAATGAFALLATLEERLSKFVPESDVALLNALGAERRVVVGPDLLRLLEVSRHAWELTGGAFDPTIGPLMDAWGLVDLDGRIPDAALLARRLACRGMDLVDIDSARSTVRFARPGVAIDLGGIGKGYVADRVAALLRERGVAAGAVLSGSSTIVVWGEPARRERWRAEIVHPRDRGAALAEVELEPGALSTSGSAEREIRVGRERIGHILDPRDGRPVRRVEGVTVWTDSALLGDVVSTTLFVLGREALAPAGALSRLLESALGAPGGASAEVARASVALVEPDASVWGGLRLRIEHFGAPGFRRIDGGDPRDAGDPRGAGGPRDARGPRDADAGG